MTSLYLVISHMKEGVLIKTNAIIFISIVTVITIFCLIGYWTNRQLEVTHETLSIDNLPKPLEGIKILHVSDIHYGRLPLDKRKLIETAKKEQPQIILITGDTVDRTENVTTSGIPVLINQLAEIAPTFVIEGNHERTSGQYEEWRQIVLQTNATLLENQVIPVTINSETFAVIGLMNGQTNLPVATKETLNNHPFALLMAHHPERFESYLNNFKAYPVVGIFSGHAHGGQVRLPFIDGLLAPNQGFLPSLTNGPYTSKTKPETTIFVSRGLGNSKFPFRINNKPHLISVVLQAK